MLKMCNIDAGEYLRGNEFENIALFEKELKRQGYLKYKKHWYEREFPRHKVIISKPFQISANLVTFSQFATFLKASSYTPTVIDNGNFFHWEQDAHQWSHQKVSIDYFLDNALLNSENPVTGVSWIDAQEFIYWLSTSQECVFRLPTEAEWELVARDGFNTVFPYPLKNSLWEGSLDEYSWNINNSKNSTFPVGQKKPNSKGVFDILGNVWEWCLDSFDEYEYSFLNEINIDPVNDKESSLKSLKGGSYLDYARSLRPADRFGFDKSSGSDDIGFRLVSPSV